MKYTNFFLVLPLLVTISSRSLYAANWYVEPSIGFVAGFDDNPALLSATEDTELAGAIDPREQSYTGLSGTILIGTDTARDSLQSSISSSFRQYDESTLDSETIDSSLSYTRSGEINTYNLGVSYSENSTLDTEFLDSGELELDLKRQEFSIEPSISRDLSTETSVNAGFSFRKVTFDSDSGGLVEFEQTGASAGVSRMLTERLSINTDFNAVSYKPTSTILVGEVLDDQSYSITAGLDYSLRENILFSLSLGPQYSERSFFGNEREDEDSSSSVYEMSLSRTGFASTFSIHAARSVSSSALGGLVESDTYGFNWLKPGVVGGDLSTSFSYQEREDDSIIMSGRKLYSFELGYTKPLSVALSYSVSYRYRQQEAQSIEEDVDSNSINLNVQYSFGRKNLSN